MLKYEADKVLKITRNTYGISVDFLYTKHVNYTLYNFMAHSKFLYFIKFNFIT